MSRIVHVDHRAEELVELGWEVGDVGAGPRLEEVGLTACCHDVGVFGERVVAGPRREVFGPELGEEANRVAPSQGLNAASRAVIELSQNPRCLTGRFR